MTFLATTLTIVFLPLLLPVWQQRPLAPEDLTLPQPSQFATPEALKLQLDSFNYVDPEQREAMLRNFGRVDTAAARDTLADVAETTDDAKLKATALAQLANFANPPEKLAHLALVSLTHKDLNVRINACRLAAQLPPNQQLADILLQLALNNSDVAVAAAALDALRPNQITKLQRARLVPLLRDDSSSNRRRRAWAAFLAPGVNAMSLNPELAKTIMAEKSLPVQVAITKSIRPVHGNQALPILSRLSDDPQKSVRAQAAAALAYFPDEHAQDILLKLLQDEDFETRRQAATGLAEFANFATVGAAIKQLGDPSAVVRRELVNTITRSATKVDVAGMVAQTLEAKNENARECAYVILERIDAKTLAPEILKNLKREKRAANIAAAIRALGKMEYKNARATVANLADHEDENVRIAAAEALGRIGDKTTRETLATLINDQKTPVRVAAITATGRLKDASFMPQLEKILLDARRMTASFTQEDRMAAMWAAASMKSIPDSFAKLVHQHITRPVIPTQMGPVFDGEPVLASGIFALAQMARTTGTDQCRKLFQAAHRIFTRAPENANSLPNSLMPSPALADYARQAELYLNRTPTEQIRATPMKPRHVQLLYQAMNHD